jgi:hypothetical protein
VTLEDSTAGVQDAPTSQVELGAALTLVADAGSVAEPLENCVEVIVTFQPAPLPVASAMSIGSDVDVLWSVPSRVRAGNVRFAGVEAKDNAPASSVPVALPVPVVTTLPAGAATPDVTETTSCWLADP